MKTIYFNYLKNIKLCEMWKIINNPIMKILILACVLALATAGNLFLEQDPIIEYVNNLKTTWKAGHNHYFDGKTID